MKKNERPLLLQLWGNSIAIISVTFAFITFFCRENKSEVIVISFLILAIGIVVLIYTRVSKISFLGLNYEVLRKVNTIRKRMISNQTVTTIENSNREWFWLDEAGIGYKLPDKVTAEFMSSKKGVIKVSRKEFTVKTQFPSFVEDARPKYQGPNVFILYNSKIYYQSSLNWLYKLAALNSVSFTDDDFRKWTDANSSKWVQPITPQDFKDNDIG